MSTSYQLAFLVVFSEVSVICSDCRVSCEEIIHALRDWRPSAALQGLAGWFMGSCRFTCGCLPSAMPQVEFCWDRHKKCSRLLLTLSARTCFLRFSNSDVAYQLVTFVIWYNGTILFCLMTRFRSLVKFIWVCFFSFGVLHGSIFFSESCSHVVLGVWVFMCSHFLRSLSIHSSSSFFLKYLLVIIFIHYHSFLISQYLLVIFIHHLFQSLDWGKILTGNHGFCHVFTIFYMGVSCKCSQLKQSIDLCQKMKSSSWYPFQRPWYWFEGFLALHKNFSGWMCPKE